MIVDLINSYTGRKTTVSGFSVGTFVFDCELEGGHESQLEVPENPLESGALVADHSYLLPKTYSVRGLMVSYKPQPVLQSTIASDLQLAKKLPVLFGVVAQAEQAIAKINRYVGKVSQAVQTAQKVAKRLGPILPDQLASFGDNTGTPLSRQSQAYNELLNIQRNRELLEVTSGLRTYPNMQLLRVQAVEGPDDAVQFVLEFKEITIVETRTVQGLVVNVPVQATATTKPDGSKKTGRAAQQAAKPKSKGTTQPVQQKPQNKSLARSIGDLIRG